MKDDSPVSQDLDLEFDVSKESTSSNRKMNQYQQEKCSQSTTSDNRVVAASTSIKYHKRICLSSKAFTRCTINKICLLQHPSNYAT